MCRSIFRRILSAPGRGRWIPSNGSTRDGLLGKHRAPSLPSGRCFRHLAGQFFHERNQKDIKDKKKHNGDEHVAHGGHRSGRTFRGSLRSKVGPHRDLDAKSTFPPFLFFILFFFLPIILGDPNGDQVSAQLQVQILHPMQ